MSTVQAAVTHNGLDAHDSFGVAITSKRLIAEDICEFHLRPTSESDALPGWGPGAHIDLQLPSGRIRQYSLCGEVGDHDYYRIAARIDRNGRGGSLELGGLAEGTELRILAVRNNFPLFSSPSYLFLIGGIGVTPIVPMVREARSEGANVDVVYLVRNADCLAFADELAAEADSITTVLTDSEGIPEIGTILADHPSAESIYCCGPEPMLSALRTAADEAGRLGAVHIERFGPAPVVAGDAKTILCARSGVAVEVAEDETFLEALRGAGFDLPSSCEMGICGTCQISVLAGTPDHQDMLLTDEEKEAGAFLPCVSRCSSRDLEVDL
jgi:ferredoxin-NADP reductase